MYLEILFIYVNIIIIGYIIVVLCKVYFDEVSGDGRALELPSLLEGGGLEGNATVTERSLSKKE